MNKILKPFKADKLNYSLYGILFGICFPILAIFLKEKPDIMFGIICTAPIFLGSLAWIAGCIQDSTESKVISRTNELEKANDIANKAVKSKSEFLANMSHELRTPLNGILGITEAMSKENFSKEQIEYMDLINYSGQNLLSIVNELLDFSKLEADKMKINNHQFSFERLLFGIESSFSIIAESKGIKFSINKSKYVPKEMISDDTRIFQILNNLVGNAIKFTNIGSVNLSINVNTIGKRKQLEMIIEDTGIGLSKEGIEKLFIPFEQATATTDREFGGTGLGLSIVNNILKLMSGNLIVESEPGKGSKFTITLDFEEVKSSQVSRKDTDEVPTNKSFKDVYKYSILVADDNMINQKVIGAFLKKLGYEIEFADNGLEVIEALEYKDFDIIFMDMMMPKMNGIEATLEIRKNKKIEQPYIISLTANSSAESQQTCKNAGMDTFMSKPVSLRAVKEKIINISDIKKVS
jgi:signal transduction histidine kinase/CheY-like chemotaxis protein